MEDYVNESRSNNDLMEATIRSNHKNPGIGAVESLVGSGYHRDTGMAENTAFYSILGKGGGCYGITVYEGYEAFNSFLLLTMREQMNLSVEYAMFNQINLTCYWGNRDELSAKQRKIVKELGYKYRGKNNWLYFLSSEPGYYPFNLDQDEVARMTGHMETCSLLCFQQTGKRGNMVRNRCPLPATILRIL